MIDFNLQQDLQRKQVLVDVAENGKVRPWKEKKEGNSLLAVAYDSIDGRKAQRLRACATAVSFAVGKSGKKTLRCANFCRVRLCPMCAWRRTMKIYSHTRKIVDELSRDGEYRYIFVTLTVKNCLPESLNDTVDGMMAGFKRLTEYADFSAAVKGWYRGLEITHNVANNTYHPHFHLLCVVKKSYFKGHAYLSQERWVQMWRKAARLDYDPVCDVRCVKGDTAAAVAEVAKYAVKDADYILPEDWDLTEETVRLLDKVLAKRRLVAYGGVMKDMHRQLNLDDEIDGDLVHVDEESVAEENEAVLTYYWHVGYRQYFAE